MYSSAVYFISGIHIEKPRTASTMIYQWRHCRLNYMIFLCTWICTR